jgi:hypothetical protein
LAQIHNLQEEPLEVDNGRVAKVEEGEGLAHGAADLDIDNALGRLCPDLYRQVWFQSMS